MEGVSRIFQEKFYDEVFFACTLFHKHDFPSQVIQFFLLSHVPN